MLGRRPDAVWPVAELPRGETVARRPRDAPFAEPADRGLAAAARAGAGGAAAASAGRAPPPASWSSGSTATARSTTATAASSSWSPARSPPALANARSYEAERRRAEALAELDRAKTDFFSNVSHEFRTPLTLIMGPVAGAARLARRREPSRDARRSWRSSSRNGLRLAKLVNTLLDFSRIQAGRIQARFEPVDLARGPPPSWPACSAPPSSGPGWRFTVDCPPLGEPVYVDRDMWEKVVLNLLSNALKFTFEGGITVRSRRDGTDAVADVADTGIGMPAAELPRLFERFHRVEAPARAPRGQRDRPGAGPGAGRAARRHDHRRQRRRVRAPRSPSGSRSGSAHLPADARRRRRSHAGGLRRRATPIVARGAALAPRRRAADRPRPDRRRRRRRGRQAGRPRPGRVLVADDNADMREYLARLLRAAGYQVDAVTDGQAALEAVRADRPDLVVSDVMMPRPGRHGAAARAARRPAHRARCRCCCCRPGPVRKPRSRACRPAPTTTW